MKFTILLLVVLVSSTFAVPMALKKGRRPPPKGSAQSGEGGLSSGTSDGGMDEDEKIIREGIKACREAISCDKEEATPEDDGTIGARRRQLKREEQALNCEEFAKGVEEDLSGGAKRSVDVDEAVLDEIREGMGKCIEAGMGCGQKVEDEKPVERFLKRMTEAENEAGCKKALEAIEGLMEEEEAGGSQPNEEEPASTTEAPPARRALLKQLLQELYAKK